MTFLGILIDAVLFLLKLVAGIAAGSVALIADAVNSLVSALAHAGFTWSAQDSNERAEQGIPFAHGKAEPMVAFAIALFTGIAAFQLVRLGLAQAFSGTTGQVLDWLIVSAIIISVIGKALLSHETQMAANKTGSVALLGTAADYRNDIIVSLVALTGLVFATAGFPFADGIAALTIGIFLLWEAYQLGQQTISYIGGERVPRELERKIREAVSTVRGVRGIHTLKAHHLGNYVQLELAIAVSPNITVQAAQHIAMTAQRDVEALPGISKAFVHADL